MMMQIGYWAKLLDDANAEPVAMLGSASPEDAAGAFAQRLIEQTEGAWIAGAVSVWGAKQAEEDATIFDISARFVVNADDEDEIDCEVEIVERFDEEM
jgi:hypothetical protein